MPNLLSETRMEARQIVPLCYIALIRQCQNGEERVLAIQNVRVIASDDDGARAAMIELGVLDVIIEALGPDVAMPELRSEATMALTHLARDGDEAKVYICTHALSFIESMLFGVFDEDKGVSERDQVFERAI